MSLPPNPSRPPTPTDYAVIAFGFSGLLVVLGAIGLGFGLSAASRKPEVAAALIYYSGWSLGIGLFVGFAYWLVRRFTD